MSSFEALGLEALAAEYRAKVGTTFLLPQDAARYVCKISLILSPPVTNLLRVYSDIEQLKTSKVAMATDAELYLIK